MITTHVGSLARLPEVVAPMKARESGASVDQAAFARAVKGAVDTVVRKQVELGIDVVSDGEQSKTSFNNYITERMTGFEPRSGIPSGAGTPAVDWSGSRERADFPAFYE